MKCAICRVEDTCSGTTSVTLTRESLTLVVKDVPALICENCGEEYVEDTVTARLLETAEEALQAGVPVDVLYYIVA